MSAPKLRTLTEALHDPNPVTPRPGHIVRFKRSSPFSRERRPFYVTGEITTAGQTRLIVEDARKETHLSVHESHVVVVGAFDDVAD